MCNLRQFEIYLDNFGVPFKQFLDNFEMILATARDKLWMMGSHLCLCAIGNKFMTTLKPQYVQNRLVNTLHSQFVVAEKINIMGILSVENPLTNYKYIAYFCRTPTRSDHEGCSLLGDILPQGQNAPR